MALNHMEIGKSKLLCCRQMFLLWFLASAGGHPSVALLREEAAAPTGRRCVVLVRARAGARGRIRGRVRVRVVRRPDGGGHGAHGG